MTFAPMTKTLLALALASVTLQADAHRPWLLPQVTNVEAKEAWVTIDGVMPTAWSEPL